MPRNVSLPSDYAWPLKSLKEIKIQPQVEEISRLNHLDNIGYCKDDPRQEFYKILPESFKDQDILAVRDEYAFDFLELGEAHSERKLECAITPGIDQFLCESDKAIDISAYRAFLRLSDETKGDLPESIQIELLLKAIDLPKGDRDVDNVEVV